MIFTKLLLYFFLFSGEGFEMNPMLFNSVPSSAVSAKKGNIKGVVRYTSIRSTIVNGTIVLEDDTHFKPKVAIR